MTPEGDKLSDKFVKKILGDLTAAGIRSADGEQERNYLALLVEQTVVCLAEQLGRSGSRRC
jgi:hypothetical protein